MSGRTGKVKFDEKGSRKEVNLEILNLQNNSFKGVSILHCLTCLYGVLEIASKTAGVQFKVYRLYSRYSVGTGGVRHHPQRFMGKTVTVPHFNRDTVEFASRKQRDESNPGIKTLLPLQKRTI